MLGATTLHAVKNPNSPQLSIASSSASLDSTNHIFCNTIVVVLEKNLHVNGPVQFKSVLFGCQLYWIYLVYHSFSLYTEASLVA